jgi:hypothetical protein
MATYKVIQDIEAEDKLVGPFSFRQFVYILIAAFLGYLSFICVAKGAAFLLILFIPPMVFCLFFAWPWTPDQPTEVWALARIRFLVKSRKRVWNQSGIKEFVTVTVPKKIERNYTDGLSQTEVRSRLHALAHTIDTRGWAIKNASMSNGAVVAADPTSDRLLDFAAMPQEVSNLDIRDSDDILDEVNNPSAQQMTTMIDESSRARRQDLMDRLQSQGAHVPRPAGGRVAAPKWFQRMNPSSGAVNATAAPAANPTASGFLPPVMPAAVQPVQAQQMPAQQSAAEAPMPTLPAAKPPVNSHLKNLSPEGDAAAQATPATPLSIPEPAPAAAPVTTTVTATDTAILNLAHDNNRNVASLARDAKRIRDMDESDDEVVVSLR